VPDLKPPETFMIKNLKQKKNFIPTTITVFEASLEKPE
jgi:hypothetical protein